MLCGNKFSLIFLSCSSNEEQVPIIENGHIVNRADSTSVIEDTILPEIIESIDTIGINEYWKENKITSATLYLYAPIYSREGSRANIMNQNDR